MECIPLGPLDHIAPCNIPQSIIYLSLKRDIEFKEAFACLREGLRRTILQEPWLSGRVYLQSQHSRGWRPGQLEIRYNPIKQDGELSQTFEIPLRYNELLNTTSFAELRESGFPMDIFDDETLLWTSPFNPDFKLGAEIFAAQANFVPGGCLLVLSIAPPASDGTAMLSITKMWADHCSSLICDGKDTTATKNGKPLHLLTGNVDRKTLDAVMAKAMDSSKVSGDLGKPQVLGSQHLVGMYGCLGANKDESQLEHDTIRAYIGFGTPYGNSQDSNMKPGVFYMPQPMYTELRRELVLVPNSVDVSGNDIICAFIWRSVLRAWAAVRTRQETDSDEIAVVAIPFDARQNLLHLLPGNFLGNLNFENTSTLSLRTLISPETSVASVANIIRTNATRQSHESSLLQAYRLLQSVKEYGNHYVQIRASHLSTKSPSVGILSPVLLPFNSTCFGEHMFANGGNPEAFRPMMGMCNRGYRICFVIPRKQHGGIEFVMTLSKEERRFLQDDNEFNRYAFAIN